MNHILHTTAVYENGILKLPGPLPDLANGDRVEVAVVRTVSSGADSSGEVARRERLLAAFDEQTRQLAAQLPDAEGDDYDVLEAMSATRRQQGERPLIPPTEAR